MTTHRPWHPLPSLLNPTFGVPTTEMVKTVGPDRIRMYAIEAGRGRPLVFLHGLGWDHRLWARTLAKYSTDYRVIAGDMRGHGRSSGPSGPYGLEALVGDWRDLLDSIDAPKVCLVGFSLGGIVAQHLATTRPDRVEALILAATVCASPAASRELMEKRIAAARAEGSVAAAWQAARQIFSPAFVEAEPGFVDEFVRWRAQMPQEPLFAAIRAIGEHNLCEALRRLDVPSLVLAGDQDALTPPSAVCDLAEHIPGAELEVVSGSGHMIPVERPNEFERHLDAFLSRHYPPAIDA